MTLRVSGKNLDIGESLRQHVLEKVEAMVAHYFNGSVGGHVVISPERVLAIARTARCA